MRDISNALREKQELTRQGTIEKIQNAINDLKAEGHLIGIKHLVDRTVYLDLFSESRMCRGF